MAAKATSAWYQLPPRTPDRPLVTVAAAGAIWYYNEDGSFNYGQSLKLQWGVHRPDGSYQALNEVQPIDIFQQKAWRNLRFPLASAPPEANVARIVADDPNLSEDQWFGFTPPRVPVLQTASEFLGSQTPVLMDIATAANFPCQRPFAEHLGVAELPEYRIMPELQADGGVVEPVAVRRRRRTVPVHPGAAAHRRPSRPTCATTGTGTGDRSSATTGWCRATRRPTPSSRRESTRVFGWSRGGPIRALP